MLSTYTKKLFGGTVLSIVLIAASCTKLVEVGPPVTNTADETVYTDDQTAIAVFNGFYGQNSDTGPDGAFALNAFMALRPELSADELEPSTQQANASIFTYYRNALTSLETLDGWAGPYQNILTLNYALAGLMRSTTLTPAVRQQLLGEAKFLRAFHYFYLTNLYGKVPLVLGTDWKTNLTLSRSPVDTIMKQVLADLTDAETLLSEAYLDINVLNPTDVRVAPVKWAATAMLARVYLFRKEYAKAAAKASEVLSHTSLYRLEPLTNVFLKTSREAIWQLQPTNAGWDTKDANFFVIPSTGINDGHPVQLSPFVMEDFEPGDQRRSTWVGTYTDPSGNPHYYPYKYKKVPDNISTTTQGYRATEYHTVMRLAEQYLIRAEARAYTGDFAGSKQDIDSVRLRAGLSETTAGTREDLVAAVMQERRIEFFAEWGHRWLDLKRTGMVDPVMSKVTPLKGGTWSPNWALYPIPKDELRYGHYLDQNEGY